MSKEIADRIGMELETELIFQGLDYDGIGEPHPFTYTITLSKVLEYISQESHFSSWEHYRTFDHVSEAYCSVCEEGYLYTLEEYKKKESESQRERLERVASSFARKHKVGMGSLEFIRAIHEEIERVECQREQWNNPEVRMEEYAACRFSGAGTDTYFDDLNYVNGQHDSNISELYAILDWLGECCPLLMAQYHEMKLGEQK